MPTPPLLVLHSLLRALSLPLTLPHLSTTTPSLLLLLLESLLARRLPLSPELRHAEGEDEVELAKCVVGVLAAELQMDLSVVEPERVVAGAEGEVGAVVMALAVLARRRGVLLDLEEEEGDDEDSYVPEGTPHARTSLRSRSFSSSTSLLDDPVDYVGVQPLQPQLIDLYTTPPRREQQYGAYFDQLEAHAEYEPDYTHTPEEHSHHAHGTHAHEHTYETSLVSSIRSPSPVKGARAALYPSRARPHGEGDYASALGKRVEAAHVPQYSDAPTRRSVSSGSGRSRTMLQTLIDEFGLVPR